MTYHAYTDHVFDVVCEEHNRFKPTPRTIDSSVEKVKLSNYLEKYQSEMSTAVIKEAKKELAHAILHTNSYEEFEKNQAKNLAWMTLLPADLFNFNQTQPWTNEHNETAHTYTTNSIEAWLTYLDVKHPSQYDIIKEEWNTVRANTVQKGKKAVRFNKMKTWMRANPRNKEDWPLVQEWTRFQQPAAQFPEECAEEAQSGRLKPRVKYSPGFFKNNRHPPMWMARFFPDLEAFDQFEAKWVAHWVDTHTRFQIPPGAYEQPGAPERRPTAEEWEQDYPPSWVGELTENRETWAWVKRNWLKRWNCFDWNGLSMQQIRGIFQCLERAEAKAELARQQTRLQEDEQRDQVCTPPDDTTEEAHVGELSQSAQSDAPAAGVVTGSGGGGAVIDPLAASEMTTTATVAQPTQVVAGTDSSEAPMVLQTMGGLVAELLPLVGYADNVVRLCSQFVLTKRYSITTATQRGTILDDIPFNPWDTTVVSQPIAKYGNLHKLFSGSIEFELQSYSATTIIGAIIMAYVPPNFAATFNPTIENMTALKGHVVLDLKEPGTCTLSVTGGNLKDAAVARREIEISENPYLYGRVIVMAYANIYNSYDQSLEIPMYRRTRLGDGAYFSEPAFLSEDGDGPVIPPTNTGPYPAAFSAICLDGDLPINATRDPSYTNHIPERVTSSAGNVGFPVKIGRNGQSWEMPPSDNPIVDLEHTWSIGCSTNDNPQYYQFKPREVAVGEETATGQYPLECKRWTTAELTNKDATITYSGALVTMEHEEGLLEGAYAFITKAGTEERPAYIAVNDSETTSLDLSCSLVTDVFAADGSQASSLDFKTQLSTQPTTLEEDLTDIGYVQTTQRLVARYSGVPVATSYTGTGGSTSHPEYKRLLFIDDTTPFVPGVNANYSTNPTMAVTRTTGVQTVAIRSFLQTENIGSYSYDIGSSSGTYLGTMLCNKDGCFLRVQDITDQYFLYNSSVKFSNYQAYSEEYPAISYFAKENFVSRLTSAKLSAHIDWDGYVRLSGESDDGYTANANNLLIAENRAMKHDLEVLRKQVDRIIHSRKAESEQAEEAHAGMAMAAIGGGLLSGVGAGLGSLAQMNNSNKQLEAIIGSKERIARWQMQTSKHIAQIQKDANMARFGYGADVAMRGGGGFKSLSRNNIPAEVGAPDSSDA
jgi:hypothetical protein